MFLNDVICINVHTHIDATDLNQTLRQFLRPKPDINIRIPRPKPETPNRWNEVSCRVKTNVTNMLDAAAASRLSISL